MNHESPIFSSASPYKKHKNTTTPLIHFIHFADFCGAINHDCRPIAGTRIQAVVFTVPAKTYFSPVTLSYMSYVRPLNLTLPFWWTCKSRIKNRMRLFRLCCGFCLLSVLAWWALASDPPFWCQWKPDVSSTNADNWQRQPHACMYRRVCNHKLELSRCCGKHQLEAEQFFFSEFWFQACALLSSQ